jgi:hypothetical protein
VTEVVGAATVGAVLAGAGAGASDADGAGVVGRGAGALGGLETCLGASVRLVACLRGLRLRGRATVVCP